MTYENNISNMNVLLSALVMSPECRTALKNADPEIAGTEHYTEYIKDSRRKASSDALRAAIGSEWETSGKAVLDAWRGIFPSLTLEESFKQAGRLAFSSIGMDQLLSLLTSIKENQEWRQMFLSAYPELTQEIEAYNSSNSQFEKQKNGALLFPKIRARWFYVEKKMVPDYVSLNATNLSPLSYTPAHNPRELSQIEGVGQVVYVLDDDEDIHKKLIEIRARYRHTQIHIMPPKIMLFEGIQQQVVRIFVS